MPTPTYLRYPNEIIEETTDYFKIEVRKYNAGSAIGVGTDFNTSSLLETSGSELAGTELNSVIVLPIPSNIQDGNSVGWGESELNKLTAFGINEAQGLMESKPEEILDKLLGSVQRTANLGVQQSGLIRKALSAEAVSIFGGNISLNSLLARESGTILNPNMELLFNGVTLRTFRFSFKMTPRDNVESSKIKKIIWTLKKNMAPSASNEGGFFLNTPNIFQIMYMKGSSPHPFLNKFKLCALKDMSVNYTGENTYVTYSDGTPISMIMDLTFQELFPIYGTNQDYGENAPNLNDERGVGY